MCQKKVQVLHTVPKTRKRIKSGHEKTRIAICLDCYESYSLNQNNKKIWLTRFNKSTANAHLRSIHGGTTNRIYAEDDPRVADAVAEYRKQYDMNNFLLNI